MLWYRINDKWVIDLSEVRVFGKPSHHPKGHAADNLLCFKYKNDKEQYFVVENRDEVFEDICRFISFFNPHK